MAFFDKFLKKSFNTQSNKKINIPNKESSSKRINTKRPKFILYDESTLNKQEFFRDKTTMKNDAKIIHSSLQIGTDGKKWSKMTATTRSRKGHKNDYIKLDNPTKNGDYQFLEKNITTNTIKTRGEKVNRSRLTQQDLNNIKNNINAQLGKKKIVIKKPTK